MNNIKFDFITNTITVTKGFYEEAMNYGTEEHETLARIQKEYPRMKIAMKSNRRGKTASDYKGLTYDYMRRFIRIMDKENIVTFDDVIAHYEDFGYTSGKLYQCVKDWFLLTYPRHKEMIVDATPQKAA